MTRLLRALRAAGVLGLALGLLLAAAGRAAAQETATLTVHSRICPAGEPTSDIFADCHGNVPAQTVSFSVDGGAAQDVGADGNVTFTGLAAGAHAVTQVDGPPFDFVHLRVFCSVQGTTTEPAEEVAVDLNEFAVSLTAGAETVCDAYIIAEDQSGNTPTPVPTAEPTAQPTAQPTATSTSGGVTTLPNTGTGAGDSNRATLTFLAGAAVLLFVVLATALRPAARRAQRGR